VRPRALAIFSALSVVVALAGCGASGTNSIVLYNGQHPQLTSALVAAFERQTGIKVRVRTSNGIVLADQILQEGADSGADVYMTENSPELVTLDEHRLLAPVDRQTLLQIPRRYQAPSGDWVGITSRVSALVYSPGQLPASELPSSILQLAQPHWKGKIAIAPTDSDFAPLVGAVIATYGKSTAASWLAGLKRNAQIYENDEAVVAAVNGGDVATGMINSYYWFRLRLEVGPGAMHSAVYYFPNHDVGSIESVSGAAMLASSHKPRRAQAFLQFLVSRPAQEILARGDDYEYPTRPGVGPNPALPSLATIAPASLSAVALGNDQQAAKLIQESGLA
jgi:iron(III) transport system substrate-binding protein